MRRASRTLVERFDRLAPNRLEASNVLICLSRDGSHDARNICRAEQLHTTADAVEEQLARIEKLDTSSMEHHAAADIAAWVVSRRRGDHDTNGARMRPAVVVPVALSSCPFLSPGRAGCCEPQGGALPAASTQQTGPPRIT